MYGHQVDKGEDWQAFYCQLVSTLSPVFTALGTAKIKSSVAFFQHSFHYTVLGYGVGWKQGEKCENRKG